MRKRGNPTGRRGRDWSKDPKEVKELVRWLKAEKCSPLTIRRYRRNFLDFAKHVNEQKGRFDVTKVGWKDVRDYKDYLFSEDLSNRSVDSYMQAVRKFFSLKAERTMATKWVNLNEKVKIASKVKDKKKGSRKWRALPWATIQEVIARKDELYRNGETSPEDWVFFMLGLWTAGRAQFYGLRVDDIDFETGWVRKKVKRGKPWEIPLHPELRAILEEHLRTRGYESDFIFKKGADPELWAGTMDKIHAYEKNGAWAYRTYRRIQDTLGLRENLHPHRIRKSFATLAKRRGMDVQYTQQILGHDDIAMTLDIYTEVDQRDVRRAYEKLTFKGDAGSPVTSDNGGEVPGPVEVLHNAREQIISGLEDPTTREMVDGFLKAAENALRLTLENGGS